MAASATSAPAASWGARTRDTPGNVARWSEGIAASRLARSVTSACVTERRTYGPSAEGAAPEIRASCRNVLDVATARSGCPGRATSAACRAISARTCLRNCRTCSGAGGFPLSQSLVSRAAPNGSEMATSGSSSMPAAISSDPPPMSSINSRPEDQPNQRRAARNVSRASCRGTLIATPVASLTLLSPSSPFAASRTAEEAKASSSSTPLSSAICSASSTNARSCRVTLADSRFPSTR